jgi:hypothetical protein
MRTGIILAAALFFSFQYNQAAPAEELRSEIATAVPANTPRDAVEGDVITKFIKIDKQTLKLQLKMKDGSTREITHRYRTYEYRAADGSVIGLTAKLEAPTRFAKLQKWCVKMEPVLQVGSYIATIFFAALTAVR